MHDNKKHQCPECDFRATRKDYIKLHIIRDHKKVFNFKCSQCPKEYAIKSDLNCHIQMAHKERTLKCPYCYKFFSIRKNLKKHLYLCHNADFKTKKIFACDKCDYKTAVKLILQKHIDVKHNGKPCCKFCDFQSTSPPLVEKHTQIIHENGSKCNLSCDKCSHQGKNWKDYREHLKSSHPDSYEYLMEKAGLLKNYESIYNNPLKRNVKCTKCDQTFSFIQDMKIHVKAFHEGVKYKCDQCDFQSGYKKFLKSHIKRVHELYMHKYCGSRQ